MNPIRYEDSEIVPPTLDQWKRLFEATDQMYALEPWVDFTDADWISIPGSDGSEVICTILGHEGIQYGISIYPGPKSRSDSALFRYHEDYNIPLELVESMIHMCVVYWDAPYEASATECHAAESLGLNYQDKLTPHFFVFEPGYRPWLPSGEDADKMAANLETLAQAIHFYRKHDLGKNSIEEFLYRYGPDPADPNKPWVGKVEPQSDPVVGFDYLVVNEANTLLPQPARRTDAVLQMNVVALNQIIKEPGKTKPYSPKMVLLCDRGSGRIEDYALLQPPQQPSHAIASMLLKYMETQGVPSQVQVANTMVEAALLDIARRFGIEVSLHDVLDRLDMATQVMLSSLDRGNSDFFYAGLQGEKS